MRTAPVWLALPAAALVGCGGGRPPAPTAAEQPTATVSVTKVNYEGLDKAFKNYQGKVVLIDVWFRG